MRNILAAKVTRHVHWQQHWRWHRWPIIYEKKIYVVKLTLMLMMSVLVVAALCGSQSCGVQWRSIAPNAWLLVSLYVIVICVFDVMVSREWMMLCVCVVIIYFVLICFILANDVCDKYISQPPTTI